MQGKNAGEEKKAVKARILVVDDEHLIRWSLQKALGDSGYEVQQASSGEEALSIIGEMRPDIVLLDLWMPGEDGFRVMNEAAKRGFGSLFIVLTGAAGIETAVRAVKSGAVDYICKPFEMDDVELRIQVALEIARMNAELPTAENKPDATREFQNVPNDAS